MLRSVAVATGLLAVFALPLNGQIEIAVSPVGGVYLPTSEIGNLRIREGAVFVFVDVEHQTSLALGARAAVWFSRLGVEAEGIFSPTDVDILEQVQAGASVYMGSLNVMYAIFQAPFSPLSIYASAGGGIVARSGDFYVSLDDTTDLAGTLGLGVRFGLGPLAKIRFDVRDYVYSFKPSADGTQSSDGKLQNDILATAALEFTFSPLP